MTNPGNNILNLLLGNFKGKIAPVPGRDAGSGVKTTGFADIFNLLTIGGKSVKNTDLMGNLSLVDKSPEFDLLFDKKFEGIVDDRQVSPEKIHTRNILELINNKKNEQIDQKTNAYTGAVIKGNIASGTITGTLKNLNVDLPLSNLKANKFLNDIINNSDSPAQLEAGKYLVLDSNVENGRLHLTLQSAADPARQVNVKLPIESLVPGKSSTADEKTVSPLLNKTAQKRVELKAERPDNRISKLEELFSKLNLKELEVKNLPEAKAVSTRSQNKMAVKIIAEQAGQEVIIRGKLDKNSVKADAGNRKDNTTAGKVMSRTVTLDNTARPVDEIALTAGSNRTTAREWLLRNQKNNEEMKFFDSLTGLEDNRPFETSKESGGLVLDKLITDDRNVNQKVNLPQVRFSLPDNIRQSLKPGGRSVSIHIEPERLGPARLHLSLRDNSLAARLTVDSAQAKAAVESSLNQLTEQLARCGIKVDYIQVGVNSGEAQNHNFARQTFWNKTTRMNNLSLEEDLNEDIKTTPLTITPQPVQYVGSGGINLLA